MLTSLHIENVAVIRRADIELKNGFTVLTGETGAGKSMIIDSINLLLGERAFREIIRTGEAQATVSAVFEELSPTVCQRLNEMGFSCEDGSLMLQRTIRTDGRSQTRLDGQIITQSVQKEIARMLISIHGQSDSQKLLQRSAHRELLDAYTEPHEEMAAYSEAYRSLREIAEKLASVTQDESEKARRIEMLRYQIEDIDAVKLRSGEEETLVRERDRLLHLEQINRQVHLICRALRTGEKGSAYDLVRRAQGALRSLEGLVENADALAERLESVALELADIADTVDGFAGEDTGDPTARIDKLEGRLDAIARLKRKYGNTVDEILAYRARAAEELDALELSDEEKNALTAKKAEAERVALTCAAALRKKRLQGALRLSGEVAQTLAFLDMPRVRVEVRVAEAALGEHGGDDVEFLIATNLGEPLLPMVKIASGGELSRIMLALRSVLNVHYGADTVIFDEIDTGVSGKTARKVGIKLSETAKNTQVLCVTHSAQIASLADTHYRITKCERDGRAETDVSELIAEARVEEIARILGGIEITQAQRTAAREMINEYNG